MRIPASYDNDASGIRCRFGNGSHPRGNIMTRIGIIGIGGFAQRHLASIQECGEKGLCHLEAAVIRSTEKYVAALADLKKTWPDLRVYLTLDEMIKAEGDGLDLVTIPTGIPSHREYAVACLNRGYHVLCEKPAAGTIEDVLAMIEAQEKSGKILAIGFQHMFTPSIQRIKEIAINGDLGKLISLTSTARWKRTSMYYNRNSWAGCLEDEGSFVFDSPIQNATAHYLQNLLYLAGPTRYESALPVTIYGENYHAQNIESADTQYIRCTTAEGVSLSFAVTHATEEVDGPYLECLFEKGRITWSKDNGACTVYGGEGKILETFDNGDSPLFRSVFDDTLQAMKENRKPLSHIGNAYQHTVCINYLYKASEGIWDIPDEYLGHNEVTEEPYLGYSENLAISSEEENTVIKGIDEAMKSMYEKGGQSFFEAGLPWARKGKTLDVSLK